MLKTLDLFSGCGGLTLGLHLTKHFTSVGAIDHWKAATDTFSHNHKIKALCASVSDESVGSILDQVGSVDVVVGGPPCQGFSTSGKRALDDPRNNLVKSFFRAIEQVQPRAFLMENVVGFTNFQEGKLFHETLELSESLGFSTFAGIVLASLYGVPQRRRRFILVGLRTGVFDFAHPSTPQTCSKLSVNQQVGDGVEAWCLDDAIGDLPLIPTNSYATQPQNAFQAWARSQQIEITEHIASNHRESMLRLMSYIPQGGSAMDPQIRKTIPQELLPNSAFPNSYARLVGTEPSPTITRNFTVPSSARCIHPHTHRALTLREGARIQSFPDSYQFLGSFGDKRLMIGNAVPPLLAKALGEQLARTLN